MVDFLGLKQLSTKYGLGLFDLKLYRLSKVGGKVENFDITTDAQFKFEFPNMISDHEPSELNGKL